MAGDWIPMRVDLADDPAVIGMAAALGLDEAGVVGRLHRLWSWANRHLVDGEAKGVTVPWIDRHVATPGFAAAMLDAGWLRTRSGGVEFPHFDRWNSQGAKRRLTKTQWDQSHRPNRGHGADAPPTGNRHAVSEIRRPEKRREEKSKRTPPTPPGGEGKTRPKNPLFDALSEVTGLDPATAGGLLGKVAAALAQADPPYTPGEVQAFGSRFWELCPWAAKDGRARPTPVELQTHIGKMRAAPANPGAAPGLFDKSEAQTFAVFSKVEEAKRIHAQQRTGPDHTRGALGSRGDARGPEPADADPRGLG